MNELIPILFADVGGEQIQTCNARELHSFLDVGKSDQEIRFYRRS